jgi:hypothetical protein
MPLLTFVLGAAGSMTGDASCPDALLLSFVATLHASKEDFPSVYPAASLSRGARSFGLFTGITLCALDLNRNRRAQATKSPELLT